MPAALSDARRGMFAAAVIVAAAIALRFPTFGNPLPAIDEQFYLLTGDRLLGGANPYVDIWDRKPIGLFLIYAAIRALGGDGTLQYPIVATGFAIATAALIHVFARRYADRTGSLMAALAYLLWLNLAGGEAGQSPVFYNLPIVAAALIVAQLVEARTLSASRLRAGGCAAMLLVGLAMQVKYTAVFEGVFFGLTLLWLRWRLARDAGLLADGLLWIACALAPTALAMLAYAQMGHLDAFIFANFGSIAARGSEPLAILLKRLAILAAILAPLAAFTAAAPRGFVKLWAAAAIGAVLLFGTWFDHYALPVVAPLAIVAAPVWGAGRARVAALTVFAVALIAGQAILVAERHKRGGWEVVDAMRAAAAGQRNCPFVYDGPPAMYLLGRWCAATRNPFPSHFNLATERDAVGFRTAAEIERIMALRPDRVVTKEPGFTGENAESRAIVYRHLARDYDLVLRIPAADKFYAVFALRRDRRPSPNAYPTSAQPLPNSQPPSTSLGQ